MMARFRASLLCRCDGEAARVRTPRACGTWTPAAAVRLTVLTVALLVPPAADAQVQASYLHSLSSFTGPIRDDGVRMNVDGERNETYVIYQNLVRVFSPSGIEIFRFGDDLDLGHILHAAVDPNGNILLLSYKDGRSVVTMCDYRGVPRGPFGIAGLPDGVEFGANRVVRQGDTYYFAALPAGRVIVTNAEGRFERLIDFSAVMDAEEAGAGGSEVTGFTADEEGNLFFGIASRFRIYRIAADGTASSFGSSGSARGRFGVIAGLATDSQGNLLVADKVKCVVMIFDRSFTLLTEFGYRGPRPENLIVPDDLVVDSRDRVYVAQARRRGVSVFALTRGGP
jgi:hypothetical protein